MGRLGSLNVNIRVCRLDLEITSCNIEKKSLVPLVKGFTQPSGKRCCLRLEIVNQGRPRSRDETQNLSTDDLNSMVTAQLISKDQLRVIVRSLHPGALSLAVGHLIFAALSERSGLLLHAACLIRDHRAYIFLGKSGAGKSTITQHASHMTYVNDDKIAVRRVRGKWLAFGAPLTDNTGLPSLDIVAPIAGLYFLEKHFQESCLPLDVKQAIARMPAQLILPKVDHLSLTTLYQTMLSLAAETKSYLLNFRVDSDVSRFI